MSIKECTDRFMTYSVILAIAMGTAMFIIGSILGYNDGFHKGYIEGKEESYKEILRIRDDRNVDPF